jgi:hypothetical protein
MVCFGNFGFWLILGFLEPIGNYLLCQPAQQSGASGLAIR